MQGGGVGVDAEEVVTPRKVPSREMRAYLLTEERMRNVQYARIWRRGPLNKGTAERVFCGFRPLADRLSAKSLRCLRLRGPLIGATMTCADT